MPIQNKQQWFETYLGQRLLVREQDYFDQAVTDVFGYNAIQIGCPQHDFLRANRMSLKLCVGVETGSTLQAVPDFLPIESASTDLILLPHALEFSLNPHQILRETHRILVPEGRIVICGFNPYSLWGIRRLFGSRIDDFPWSGNFISLPRLKDWLTLLDFEMTAGRLCCYVPPFNQKKWLRRFNFMEAAGDRWWPIYGGIYFLQATKRVHGMRIIKPEWNSKLAVKKRIVPVTQRLNGKMTKEKIQMISNNEIKMRD